MHGTFWKDAEAKPNDSEQISRSVNALIFQNIRLTSKQKHVMI